MRVEPEQFLLRLSDRYTYWPVRVAQGGEILAPGNPENSVQYVDVRDLGVFTFDVGARGMGRTYNATGFDEAVTFKDMIESCIPQNHGKPMDLTITWVDADFLLEQGVGQWMEMPLWIAGGGNHYVNESAREDGLKFRPLKDTAAATAIWHAAERGEDHKWRAGMAAEKEATVLAWMIHQIAPPVRPNGARARKTTERSGGGPVGPVSIRDGSGRRPQADV